MYLFYSRLLINFAIISMVSKITNIKECVNGKMRLMSWSHSVFVRELKVSALNNILLKYKIKSVV